MKKTPGSRREGRVLAVQLIYMLDHNSTPFEQVLPGFLSFIKDNERPLIESEKSRDFCVQLARGTVEHWKQIDELIKETTANFTLHRIGGVERAIMRLAIYEMLHCLETPPVVAINEAVEIAKLMTGDEAGRFINGVLDKIRATLKRDARKAVVPFNPVQMMEKRMEDAARELGSLSSEQPEEFSPGRETPPEQI